MNADRPVHSSSPISKPFLMQGGVALALALLLLFVLTLLGVASFNNTYMQERSAGNARLQTVAFEAAAAGASNAINFFDENRALGPDQLCGSSGHEGWVAATDWVNQGQVGEAFLRQRMYCLADEYPCTEDEVDCDVRPPRSQLFVLSRGEVFSGDQAVASRDVEVRLAIGNTGVAGDGCGALCFPTCETGTLVFPDSNQFQVDGNGGPAVTAGCQNLADDILDGIRDNRIGNYIGGVEATNTGLPWNDPVALEEFRLNIMLAAQFAQAAGTCQASCYVEGNLVDYGDSRYGTPEDPQINYFAGDASLGGNTSGAGILLVNGNLDWRGTPQFDGLIVVLGGNYQITGGAVGGDHGGSVVIMNAPGGDPPANLEAANFYTTGGGVAEFNFDCESLIAAHQLLDLEGQALWSPECETAPEHPFEANPDELIIASWRENIGWREAFFGSEG